MFRGVLGAGEAVCFGLDSIRIPFLAEAGGILLFYVLGIVGLAYLGWYRISDTNYDRREEGAVVPNHVLEGRGLVVGQEGVARVLGEKEEVNRAGEEVNGV